MSIDWITVSAQIVNFLVLVWLLKRLLYQPVITAMERREAGIHERLEQARRREREADALAESCERKEAELEQNRERLLEEARTDAETQRQRWLEQARSDAENQRGQWTRQVESEKQAFLQALEQKASDSLRAIAGEALAGLADLSLEERMLETFLERLRQLPKEPRDALAGAEGPIRIITAFPLDSAVRARITRRVHARIDADAALDYEQDDRLICGIELSRGGFRLAWNLADYLTDVREQLASRFDRPTEAES